MGEVVTCTGGGEQVGRRVVSRDVSLVAVDVRRWRQGSPHSIRNLEENLSGDFNDRGEGQASGNFWIKNSKMWRNTADGPKLKARRQANSAALDCAKHEKWTPWERKWGCSRDERR